MKRLVTIGRIKTLDDATKAIDALAAAVNQLADENERLKAQVNALQPVST